MVVDARTPGRNFPIKRASKHTYRRTLKIRTFRGVAMRRLNRWSCVLLLTFFVDRVPYVAACEMPPAKLAPRALNDLAARAIGEDSAGRESAIAQLRLAGSDGLKALMEANADAIRAHRAS